MHLRRIFLLDKENHPLNPRDSYQIRILDENFWCYASGDYKPEIDEQIRRSQVSTEFSIVSLPQGHWLIQGGGKEDIEHSEEEAEKKCYQFAEAYAQEQANKKRFTLVNLVKKNSKELEDFVADLNNDIAFGRMGPLTH